VKPRMTYPAEARFAKVINQVNAILAERLTFRCGENCRFLDNGHSAVIAVFRGDTATQAFGFLVVCNFDTLNSLRIAVEHAPVLGTDGPFTCCELLSGETRSFPHPHIELDLSSSDTQLLKLPRQDRTV
jgi:hypothetical protein